MSIYDIAKLAGVSITTVSRVINDQKKVRQEIKTRILSIIAQYNYQPNPYAQYLGRRKNGKSETNPV